MGEKNPRASRPLPVRGFAVYLVGQNLSIADWAACRVE